MKRSGNVCVCVWDIYIYIYIYIYILLAPHGYSSRKVSSLLFACHLELDPCLAEAGFQIFLSSSSYPDIPALEKRENCGEKHNRVLRLWLVRHTWSLPLIPLEELNSWLPWSQPHGLGDVYLTGWPDIWLQPYEERTHVWILTHSLQSVSHVYFYKIFIEI